MSPCTTYPPDAAGGVGVQMFAPFWRVDVPPPLEKTPHEMRFDLLPVEVHFWFRRFFFFLPLNLPVPPTPAAEEAMRVCVLLHAVPFVASLFAMEIIASQPPPPAKSPSPCCGVFLYGPRV